DRLRPLRSADALPQRGAVVKIVRNNRAVLSRGLNSFDEHPGCGIAQRREDTSRMEPARADFAENVFPIEIARLELAGGSVAAVRNAHRAPHAEPALREIQSVAHRAPDAVIRDPLNELGVHAALQNQILEQAAYFVLGKGSAQRGLEAEATPQAAGYV